MSPTTHLDVPAWAWLALNAYIIGLLLVDLFGFNKEAHKIEWKEAAWLSAFFVAASLAVNAAIWIGFGHEPALTFFTAYIVEKSLSVDNLFVIAVLFGYFGVPAQYQHRVLFWGIFGAILMRGFMILVGVALIDRFHWLLYVFGAFLVLTGLRMFRDNDDAADVSQNKLLVFLRRKLPVTESYHEEHFFVRLKGKLWATPLFLVLIMIELTDVVFAVDSIPAILGITTDPFIAYSSNIMAVVGLRALYFLLAGIIERVRYLHYGLGFVLVFIGGKMLAEPFIDGHLPTWVSLTVIAVSIGTASVASWIATRREERAAPPGAPTPPGEADVPDVARSGDGAAAEPPVIKNQG
ncbi:TerC family protein [Rubrivirga sp. S365]|uniref:TerC family protein n=1 Tax=Rubrivirga litoralis TaxID=3075598 RepID=A0ABU3BRH7_9BACT|nr:MULTISPECIES: TerC family protein [unclassified Rubrivirga]MDT0631894.1 TerC family protein [Rubrivirga sp. F394]MDT7857947.1 TerC family protein [Rubrivirga sp. S365]